MAYIEFDHVVKEYPSGSSVIRALDEASFTADQGELSVILGQSGAGKTTALNILGGMDTATSGRVIVGDRDITGLRKRDLVTYRRNDIGFVFQFYNLVPNLTALENVELASQICPDHFDPAETLYKVGLGGAHGEFPGTTVRRRTTACIHRPRDCQKAEAAVVRRTDRCARLRDRQGSAAVAAGYLPNTRHDRNDHHA